MDTERHSNAAARLARLAGHLDATAQCGCTPTDVHRLDTDASPSGNVVQQCFNFEPGRMLLDQVITGHRSDMPNLGKL
jgi:hypothetical protein